MTRPNRWISYLVVALIAGAAGVLARGWLPPAGNAEKGSSSKGGEGGPCPGGAKPLYWKAPMDPTYIRDKPGKSPMGMDLVPVCPGEEAKAPPGAVKVDAATIQDIGVRTALVQRRSLSRKIRAVGRVSYDEPLVAHVHTKVQGWIEKLYIDYEGQQVKRGQPLLEIYSPELVSTQEELLLASRNRKITEKSPIEDVSEGGKALFEATRRRLTLFDIADSEIVRLLRTGMVRKTLTLYAPVSGVVTDLKVRSGMEVAPNDNLYTVADLSKVWIYADVYEYELPWVKVGQRATAELSYLPGVKFEGRVTYVYPVLDAKTRTVRVRLEHANPSMVLKPDMFANVTIEAGTLKNVLAIPEEAVLRTGTRDIAVLALGDGYFKAQEVTLGMSSGDGWVEILSGLRPQEKIVTSSQFLIDSESNLQEAVQKFLRSPKPKSEKGMGSMQQGAGSKGRPGPPPGKPGVMEQPRETTTVPPNG